MIDDNKALNDTAEENVSPDTTPVPEPKAPEEEPRLEEEVATDSENQESEAVEEGKKGASARIRELNSKAKQAEERAKSLEERLAELTGPSRPIQVPQQQMPQPQEDELNPDGSVNAEVFRNRVLAEADSRTELRIRQSEAINRINNEASDVLREHPELDPDSDQFDKELSDFVTETVESGVKAAPYSASPKAIASKAMNLYKRAVAKEAGQASENIAKQVSRAALRPTSVRKPEKTAADKTIEELEAELGMVIS